MSNTQKILKIIYWSSISILCFVVISTILLWCLPIEFIDKYVEETFSIFRLTVILLAIFLFVINKFKNGGFLKTFGKIMLTGLALFVIYFIVGILSFGSLCGYTFDNFLFENKENPKVKIIKKSFGCGAVDSTPATMHFYKSIDFLNIFRWISEIDTTKINKAEWNRIDNK